MASLGDIRAVDGVDTAKALFVERVVKSVRGPAVDGVLAQLRAPSGRRPPALVRELSDWFASLPEGQRTKVADLVGYSVDSALFGMMVLIDGETGGPILEDAVADFGLYLNAYADESRRTVADKVESVRVNPVGTGDALHDIFNAATRGGSHR